MSQTAQLPMKWHNFIVKVGLPLGMAFNLLTIVLYATGGFYDMAGVNAAYVYRYYKGLQMLDILYAVCLLLCAVYTLQTRKALKEFRHSAPSMLLVLYGLNTGSALLYNVAALLVMNAGLSSLTSMSTAIASGLLSIVLNKTYYQKRAHLFVY